MLIFRFVLLIIVCQFPLYALANSENKASVDFSGFARFVAGYLDEENAEFQGYSNKLTAGEHSLLALQMDASLSSSLSLTAQGVAHSGSKNKSGLAWLYLTYQPSKAWQFRLGKLRTPFHYYSDVINVGYAYHWVNPPVQLYNDTLFDTFEGISANFNFSNKFVLADIEGYWGIYDDKLSLDGIDTVHAKVTNMRGLAIRLEAGHWVVRGSYHRGMADIDIPQSAHLASLLRQYGYQRSAHSLDSRGVVEVKQLAASYQTPDYFVTAEGMQILSESNFLPDFMGVYATFGYYFDSILIHMTLARGRDSLGQPVQEIPAGLPPSLDELRQAYFGTFAGLKRDSMDSLSVGVRWDFAENWAVKGDVTHLIGEPGERSFFDVSNASRFDSNANLYQLSLEWVF